jgi:cytochrome b subunit of formate dehydrogenase
MILDNIALCMAIIAFLVSFGLLLHTIGYEKGYKSGSIRGYIEGWEDEKKIKDKMEERYREIIQRERNLNKRIAEGDSPRNGTKRGMKSLVGCGLHTDGTSGE